MRLQLLSDLHLETEAFTPQPAPEAELLVLAGDIDSTWAGLERFASWPRPVLFIAGNHEFDRRELNTAWPALRARCTALRIDLLECEERVFRGDDGRRIRFVGTTRWCDFDLFGEARRERCQRAARYFVEVMRSTRGGTVLDPAAVREEALACRDWLTRTLSTPATDDKSLDATVVITHYAPSLRSVDPRYGEQPGTASFCNADDDLLPLADLWLHGHLHCRHDYRVAHPAGSPRASTRVVSNARGHGQKGESHGHDGLKIVTV
ncbi:metallophosphoesterase [Methylibium sp.]|uniref:metallophosphoesterase n=1 Tax=Methylibium sp. TaxID=2067992 RepID=UPI00181FBDC3|nr:metallophosphoesterase [Methylibium sp.]MBA3588673.1 metallophosphoesterase [Methylibium sp.]